jgi:hypothetical protein
VLQGVEVRVLFWAPIISRCRFHCSHKIGQLQQIRQERSSAGTQEKISNEGNANPDNTRTYWVLSRAPENRRNPGAATARPSSTSLEDVRFTPMNAEPDALPRHGSLPDRQADRQSTGRPIRLPSFVSANVSGRARTARSLIPCLRYCSGNFPTAACTILFLDGVHAMHLQLPFVVSLPFSCR